MDPLVAGADHSHENHQSHGVGHPEANLPFIDLSFAHFQIAIFTGEILTGADLRKPNTFPIPFPIGGLQLRSAADITGVNPGGNDLNGMAGNLLQYDLSGLNLSTANLTATKLAVSDFSTANLTNALIETNELRFADFTGAKLNGSILGVSSRLDCFDYEDTLSVTSGTTTLNFLGFAGLGTLATLDDDATLVVGNGVALGVGENLVGNGHVDAKVAAGFGSIIPVDGDLALGDTDAFDGFFSAGVLRTNDNAVTLHDRDKAVLGSLTELGNADGPGTLIAFNCIWLSRARPLLGMEL